MSYGSGHRHIRLIVAIVCSSFLVMGTVALNPQYVLQVLRSALSADNRQQLGFAPIAPPSLPAPSPLPTATPLPSVIAPAVATLAPTRAPTENPVAAAPPSTPDGQTRAARLPILMYHYISDPPANADSYRRDLSVPPREFEIQLAYLRDAGYTSITLDDLLQHLTAGHPLPDKPVILTFDDGYLDNYLYAFPLLRQYGFSGTFFVITSLLDEARPGYISWEQAQQMQENGMDIQSHSLSHPDLSGQSIALLQHEIAGSRQAIEAHLHKPVRFFAYPFGQYDRQVIDVLRSAGYQAAVTTMAGVVHTSTALFELARVRIHGTDDLDKFKATLDYSE